MMTQNKLACPWSFLGENLFFKPKNKGQWESLGNLLVSNVNLVNLVIFWLNVFSKILTPKKMKK